MNIKHFVFKFFKNLGLSLVSTLTAFSFVIFAFLSAMGEKVSFQGGMIGHVLSSILIAWFVISVAALPPLMVFSFLLTIFQVRKNHKGN